MEQKPRQIKHDIMRRVVKLYIVIIAVGVLIAARLVYVQFLDGIVRERSSRYNSRIFSTAVLRAHRGTICARTGEPLATSIPKWRVFMDFGAEYFESTKDSVVRVRIDELADSLSSFFKDRTAAEYRAEIIANRNKYSPIYEYMHTDTLHGMARFRAILSGDETIRSEKRTACRSRTPSRVRLFRDVTYPEWLEVKQFPILRNGNTYVKEERMERIYTLGTAARSLIGNHNPNGRSSGLESAMDSLLRGEDGLAWRQRISPNFSGNVNKPSFAKRDPSYADKNNKPAVDGADIITTIDPDIQAYVDKTLREQIEHWSAICGSTMVMDVATGDLLAISNYTRIDEKGRNRIPENNSRRVQNGRLSERENIAFEWRTEPGSTFKLATMLALLEVAKMPVETVYDTGKGSYVFRVGKRAYTVHDSDGHAFGEIDMHEALVQSSNIYFARAAYDAFDADPKRYTDYLRRLHLDRKVCVGLPEITEGSPRFMNPDSRGWEWCSLFNVAYGQGGMEVTPLQTLTLYNAVANGGRMVAPRIVSEVRRDGKTIKKYPVEVLEERICSRETLEKVREALSEAAYRGTGKYQFGEGRTPFRAAMKTGTAQFAQDGYKYGDGYYVASMAMFFPAENPRYTILTNIHTNRRTGNYFGASLAGPVDQKIALYIYNRDNEWSGRLDRDGERMYPERIKGGRVSQIREVAGKASLRTEGDRRADWGRVTVVDTTAQAVVESVSDDLAVMPNVAGMGLKDALYLLESRGLRVSVSGRGAVASQSIPAGRQIKAGMDVSIVLK